MLSIDGTHIENDLGLHLLQGSNEPILSNTRDNVVTIPGMHGAYSFPSYLEPRTFFQEILIPTQATIEDVQEIVRQITPLILDENGQPKEVELRWDYEPDKYYKAKFSGYISINRIHHAGIFYLPFTAYDPFAYASATAYDVPPGQYDTGLQYDSGLMYENPSTVTWQYPIQYSGLHNYSYYNTPFNFMIEGSVINPRVTVNGKTFTIRVTLQADERLYVDSKREMAWKVKIQNDTYYWLTPNFMMRQTTEWERMNLYNEVVGDFPFLKQGDNDLTFEGGQPDATIQYNWEHRFM